MMQMIRKIARWLTCKARRIPFWGYDPGCDYCIYVTAGRLRGDCRRGERCGYKGCGVARYGR